MFFSVRQVNVVAILTVLFAFGACRNVSDLFPDGYSDPIAEQGNSDAGTAVSVVRSDAGWTIIDAGYDDGGAPAVDANPLDAVPVCDGPKNFVFFIGDGMGRNHQVGASMYAYGAAGELFFEEFPVQGLVSTYSLGGESTYSAGGVVTDSAAASTAMATGHKVNNGVIGLEIPGSGRELPNMVDFFQGHGKATGLVTTVTITHATPAGFGSHTTHRNNTDEIALDYMTQSRPNVLFGGGGYGMSPELAADSGYTVIETLAGFDVDTLPDSALFLSGQFGVGYLPYERDGLPEGRPHLWEMADTAVAALKRDPDGFFVMIEGGRIDHASHDNRFPQMVFELLAFDRTVGNIAADPDLVDDTLFIVTADHGTGGLIIDSNNGQGELPNARWTMVTHTIEDVGIYAKGPGAEAFQAAIDAKGGLIDNTDIYHIVTELIDW